MIVSDRAYRSSDVAGNYGQKDKSTMGERDDLMAFRLKIPSADTCPIICLSLVKNLVEGV
jgi:hypothetical protein